MEVPTEWCVMRWKQWGNTPSFSLTSFCLVNFLTVEMFKRKAWKARWRKIYRYLQECASFCCIYLDGSSSLYSFMVLCLGSVWYLQFRGLCNMYVCLLYSFICEFCNVGQAFIRERIFFLRNMKAFSGYLGSPKILLCIPYSMWMYVRKY